MSGREGSSQVVPRAVMVRKDPESEATEVAKSRCIPGPISVKAPLDLLTKTGLVTPGRRLEPAFAQALHRS